MTLEESLLPAGSRWFVLWVVVAARRRIDLSLPRGMTLGSLRAISRIKDPEFVTSSLSKIFSKHVD